MLVLAQMQPIARKIYAYYKSNGLHKTVWRITHRLFARISARNAYNPSFGIPRLSDFESTLPVEFAVPYVYDEMSPIGPITSTSMFIQEINHNLDFIDSFEFLLAAYARQNTNINEIFLVSDKGEVLHREDLSSKSVADNSFHALRLADRVDVRKSNKVYLVMRSPDGTADNCITVWRTTKAKGRLWQTPNLSAPMDAGGLSVQWILDHGSTISGSIIFKMSGGKKADVLLYRKPPLPDDFCRSPLLRQKYILVVAQQHDDARGSALSVLIEGLRNTSAAVKVVAPRFAATSHDLRDVDFMILSDVEMSDAAKELLYEAKIRYVPTLFFCDEEIHPDIPSVESSDSAKSVKRSTQSAQLFATFKACDYVLCTSIKLCDWSRRNYKGPFLLKLSEHDMKFVGETATQLLSDVRAMYRKRHLPMFSIVSILHGKAEQIQPVLQSYFRQSYSGKFEIIYVDDQSPDSSGDLVINCVEQAKESGLYECLPDIRVLKNSTNLGNCISRNIGIEEAKGDIIIVIDADCMVNRDFLKSHADAHSFDDCEVVIGPLNLETCGREPMVVLDEYEQRLDRVLADSQPQDQINRRSFLNCITRNFSVKADFLEENLFDPLFSYSMNPESGFGWEDVEMGYRLYLRGARIKFVTEAFSIHISHPSSVDEGTKPLRSLRNYRCLFEKHPDLLHVARRWSLDTYAKIIAWMDNNGLPINEDRRFLDSTFQRFIPAPFYIRSNRRLRVLTYRWHVPHQYELYKLPYEFTLITDLGTPMTREWELRHRPLPENVQFRSIHEVNVEDYDLAILHFDENVLTPENTNGVIGPEWGKTFQWFMRNVKLPKVAICHGTPQFYGQYNINYKGDNLLQSIEEERRKLVDFIGEVLVVSNSFQAQREWGFRKSKVIWHGFDPTEFPQATYEKNILSPFGPLLLSRPHYRGYFVYREVFKEFPEEHGPKTLYVPEPDILYDGNQYAIGKFQNYVNELRKYSVYFNPTLRSPMPRARGEAMMCGLVTVSAHNHDVDLFIINGVNGFYSDNSSELRDYLLYLSENPEQMRKIGQAGRQTALDLFNHDRYLQQWEDTITDLIGVRS